MLLVVALSGIQSYLFDVAQEGGRQARRLRARSLFIQLVAECAAIRIRRAAGWPPDSLLVSGAGKLLLFGPDLDPEAQARVASEAGALARWLLSNVGSELRLHLAFDSGEGAPHEAYRRAMRRLRAAALRTLPGAALPEQADGNAWILDPISPPCKICHHRRAEHDDPEEDSGAPRKVCRRCLDDRDLGGRVLERNYLRIRAAPRQDDINVLDLGVSFTDTMPDDGDTLAVAVLQDRHARGQPVPLPPPDLLLRRRIARHVPRIEFIDLASEDDRLAESALGARLLAVLKIDVDSLGSHVDRALRRATGLGALRELSGKLDEFFSTTLDRELERPEWERVYTVFSGGDDLLLVGPWSLMLDYAGHVQRLFSRRFQDLTLSAGIALIKPKRPIRHAAAIAARLLDQAKTEGAPPKDQCAALGQVWKWTVHQEILDGGKRLSGWVASGIARRVWLHTLLELAEARAGGDALATARLSYHVARNYPSAHDRHPQRAALRQWADRLVEDFDARSSPEAAYLAATVRYALLATRRREERE